MNPFVKSNMSMIQIKSINKRTLKIDNAIEPPKGITDAIKTNDGIFILYQSETKAKEAQQQLNEQRFHTSIVNEISDEIYTISVLNIPHTTNQLLQQTFSIFGEVSFVTIIQDDEGESKGIGYVTFKTKEAYDKAITARTLIYDEDVLQIIDKLSVNQMENRYKQSMQRKKQMEKKKLKHNQIDNVQISQVEVNQELDLINEMRTNGRLMKKKIRKIKQKVGEDNFAIVAKFKQFKSGIQKKQDQFFRIPSQLKLRREQRKQKMESNKKKANKIHKI